MTKNTCVSVGTLEVNRPGLDTHLEVHRVGLYTRSISDDVGWAADKDGVPWALRLGLAEEA